MGRRGGVGCRLDEDAAELAGEAVWLGNHQVVGPAEVGREAGSRADGVLRGEAGGEREPEGAAERERGPDEHAEVEAVGLGGGAEGGVPGVASAAAAGGLFVGDPDAGWGAGLRGFECEVLVELTVGR